MMPRSPQQGRFIWRIALLKDKPMAEGYWAEAQKISRLSALRAMTIDAAWQVFEDSKRGSIENGKLADLVILSENPLETSKSLSDIRVMQTIRRGTIAYQA